MAKYVILILANIITIALLSIAFLKIYNTGNIGYIKASWRLIIGILFCIYCIFLNAKAIFKLISIK